MSSALAHHHLFAILQNAFSCILSEIVDNGNFNSLCCLLEGFISFSLISLKFQLTIQLVVDLTSVKVQQLN